MRLIYLGYYFKKMDWSMLNRFLKYASHKTGKSKISLGIDMIYSSLKYNISLLEYFNFRFYEISNDIKIGFAGSGFMYEYQLKMNPKKYRKVLDDKWEFLKRYTLFVRHYYVSIDELEQNPETADKLLSNNSGKIVLKSINGKCGEGIEIKSTGEFTSKTLLERMKATGNNLAEEFVQQHDDLNALSPSGLNTLRIITQIDDSGNVIILGVRLRITVNSHVDNLAAGNIAAPVNSATGIVEGPGVFSDITRSSVTEHPVTGVAILGFKVPYFKESIQLAIDAALLNPSNRSIGWDIAITNQGPELIEGNHDWCKLLWQLPVNKGLKPVLLQYI